jgi:hypothetical protein
MLIIILNINLYVLEIFGENVDFSYSINRPAYSYILEITSSLNLKLTLKVSMYVCTSIKSNVNFSPCGLIE